jgi:MFS family permease
MSVTEHSSSNKNVIFLVVVAALGYFVDIYDLVLFSVVRLKSLQDIGVALENLRTDGEYVLNMQMGGLLLGGLLWGILGDKYGRIKVLFGSIIVYSLANIANGLVTDLHAYAIIRFIAGIGLAGELGAGVTLVSETMSKEKRGYGTMLIAAIGLLGASAAATVAHYFAWQTAYFIGGALGLLLLFFRVGILESGMFKEVEKSNVSKGDIFILFKDKKRFKKYLNCILIALPIWYVIGILVTQSPEIGRELGALEELSAGKGIMYTYLGIAIGDIIAGFLAQITRSRKLTMLVFLLLSVVSVAVYLNSTAITSAQFMWICFFMGISVGYWATFVTIASEQFGTNIRATVTTTVPNFVRGALIPITFLFEFFVNRYGLVISGHIVMFLLTAIALFALKNLEESFGKDLDYTEEDKQCLSA